MGRPSHGNAWQRRKAIVRLAPNNSDLYMGHNTWIGYYSMLRLLKEQRTKVLACLRLLGEHAGRIVQGDIVAKLGRSTRNETKNVLTRCLCTEQGNIVRRPQQKLHVRNHRDEDANCPGSSYDFATLFCFCCHSCVVYIVVRTYFKDL